MKHPDAFSKNNEIRKESTVWTDSKGRHWLLVFFLAEIDGRNECVGFSLRSYVRQLNADGAYEAFDVEQSDPFDLADEARRLGASEDEAYEIGFLQAQPLKDLPGGNELCPAPLNSTTLRELPFFSLLNRTLLRVAARIRETATLTRSWGEDDLADTFEGFAEWLQAEKSKPTIRRRGPRPKYTSEHLANAATVYLEAVRQGSRTPTKAVREALGLSQSSAEKLVSRCRDDDVGLIPPIGPSRESGQS
jgi:hypothetical protein